MRKKAIRKEFYREIYRTRNRFLSVFLITALGVAFFSGIRATKPDMQLSGDAFYDDGEMMDLQILGTLGVTEEDAAAVRAAEGTEDAEASRSVDMFGILGEEQLNLQVMSLPERINLPVVTKGRLPEKEDECAVDEKLVSSGVCKVGDIITLRSGTDTKTEDILRTDTFTVTGAVVSPCYLSLERGTSGIGNGTRSGFLMIPDSAFSMDYYTQICVTAKGASELNCYGEEYGDLVEGLTDRLEGLSEERSEIRFAQVKEEGEERIADAEEEIADAGRELADAEEELDSARTELADAEKELADGRRELADAEKEIAEKEAELADARQKTADGWTELNRAKERLVEATVKIQRGFSQYEEGKAELDAGYAELAPYEAQYQELETAKEQLGQGLLGVQAGLDAIAGGRSRLEELTRRQEAGESLTAEELFELQALTEQSLQWDAQEAELQAQYGSLSSNMAECQAGLDSLGPVISAARAELDKGSQELAAAKAELDAASDEVDAGNSKAYYAEQDLVKADEEIADGEKKLADGKKELEDGKKELLEAEEKIEDGRKELADGEAEYEEAKAEADEAIADAEEQIEDGKRELEELEVPEWYVLDRNYTASFADYGQNADRIGAIGEVFPVIFFLVAALVCLTTMTRMVEEERTQIGTLKALGYGRGAIAAKYILYALLSSLLGSLAGLVAGQKILPTVIITAYKILYPYLPAILTPLSLRYSAAATEAAVACTTIAAWAACYKELFAVPAKLMRPAAPKAGKRVFLERIRPLWTRLNFSRKASVRNLIRYKKRFFMTIFGIGGCTALLLVGFGLKDSVSYIGKGQFGNIFVYDAAVAVDGEAAEEEKEKLYGKVSEDENTERAMRVLETALDVEKDGVTKSVYLIVPEKAEELPSYIRLKDRETQEAYSLSDEGAVISEKLSELLGVKAGDTILLKEDETDRKEVLVTQVAENYFMNYIYMSKDLYEELFEEAPEWNMLFVCRKQKDKASEDAFLEEYMEEEAAAGVTFTSGTAEYISDMLESMNVVILVLVVSAGMLAFVVLYNLNSINISERKRELATLKVLGFYDREVSAYVNRENILLTVIGTAAGIGLGIVLHRFVAMTAETDTLMFGREIHWYSYVFSVILTFVFSAVISWTQIFRLKKIDMVESLKSVE